MAALLTLQEINRYYCVDGQKIAVLKGISLSIEAGEMVAIMGASGSGKSTLMNILGCLDQANSGRYLIADQDVAQLSGDALATLRREHFGFIFQHYHLIPHLSAHHNVEIPAVYAGVSKAERRERAEKLLQHLGLRERACHMPSQLSGGQQQRVSIARALINGGPVILADEPTGALDTQSSREVMVILKQLKDRGHTVVIVTHDPHIAAQCERIIELRDGEAIADRRQHIDQIVIPDAIAPTDIPSGSRWWSFTRCFPEAFSMAWRAISANKLRTALTMLGIVIGIASVVSILVIGNAARQQVLADIRSIGTNTVTIFPGTAYADSDPAVQRVLTATDTQALLEQPYVTAISPFVTSSGWLRFGNIDVHAEVNGINEQVIHVYGMILQEGSAISAEQVANQAQVMLIDQNTRQRLFAHLPHVVGEIVLVGTLPVTVIGVVEPNKMMFGGGNTLRVWLPYTTLNSRLLGQSWYSSIAVRIKEGYSSHEAEQQIEHLLSLLHGKKDFFTDNIDTIVQTAEKVTQTLQLFLALVALISLVVGGIGVMNIMLVSVTERTREIGIRMAVGARPRDVLQQFLIESILVCLIGGAIGLLLSLMIGVLIQQSLPGWHLSLPPFALISVFLCSTTVGIVFGYLPARNAARLKPVDALARE